MTEVPGDGWLVVVDPQVVFADPATSPWGSPMWAATVPRIAELAASFGPARTVVTRFVADPSLGGSWGPYYRDWPFALVPGDDPLYAVVPELADVAAHVVTAGTFGKWPVLRELLGDDAHVTLTGVSTDCCVLSTALPAADAGATVRVVGAACAGSTPENHERALAAMALYAPQITISDPAPVFRLRATCTRFRTPPRCENRVQVARSGVQKRPVRARTAAPAVVPTAPAASPAARPPSASPLPSTALVARPVHQPTSSAGATSATTARRSTETESRVAPPQAEANSHVAVTRSTR